MTNQQEVILLKSLRRIADALEIIAKSFKEPQKSLIPDAEIHHVEYDEEQCGRTK